MSLTTSLATLTLCLMILKLSGTWATLSWALVLLPLGVLLTCYALIAIVIITGFNQAVKNHEI